MATRLKTPGLATLTESIIDRRTLSPCSAASLFPHPIDPACELSVIIPARNEEQSLEQTLSALATQRARNGLALDPRRYEVLLLINNSSDGSACQAAQVARKYPSLRLHIAEIQLPEPDAHVGKARRLLMDAAWHRFRCNGRADGIIASTDADTIVSETWVDATIFEIRRGADAVGGRILISSEDLQFLDPDARSCHLRDVGYRALVAEIESLIDPDPADPWPRHFQHFGASVAVTASAYLKCGGLPVQESLEDVALHDALERTGASIRHSPNVRVYTSARVDGRTGFGFARQLQIWSQAHRNGHPFLVRSAEDVINELHVRRELRLGWQRSPEQLFASTPEEIPVTCESFGMYWYRFRRSYLESRRRRDRFPLDEITRATQNLRVYREHLRRNENAGVHTRSNISIR